MVERRLRRARPAETGANGGQVQSLSRALAILGVLAESGDGMTLTDVAQIVGLPPSTVHRLLTTLEHRRFVRFEPRGRACGRSACRPSSSATPSYARATWSAPRAPSCAG